MAEVVAVYRTQHAEVHAQRLPDGAGQVTVSMTPERAAHLARVLRAGSWAEEDLAWALDHAAKRVGSRPS